MEVTSSLIGQTSRFTWNHVTVLLNVYFEKVENESSDLVGEGGGEPLEGEEGREVLECSPEIRVCQR